MKLWEFLWKQNALMSRSEYKRLCIQGGIRVNDEIVPEDCGCEVEIKSGDIVMCRKKIYVWISEVY
jgi:hypothetical protein